MPEKGHERYMKGTWISWYSSKLFNEIFWPKTTFAQGLQQNDRMHLLQRFKVLSSKKIPHHDFLLVLVRQTTVHVPTLKTLVLNQKHQLSLMANPTFTLRNKNTWKWIFFPFDWNYFTSTTKLHNKFPHWNNGFLHLCCIPINDDIAVQLSFRATLVNRICYCLQGLCLNDIHLMFK